MAEVIQKKPRPRFSEILCASCSTWVHEPAENVRLEGAELDRGVADSCPMCSLLVGFWNPGSAAYAKKSMPMEFTWDQPNRMVLLRGHEMLRIFCTQDLPCPWDFFPCDNEIMSSSGPTNCFQVASRWIKNCLIKHKCGSTEADQPLPSRLIKVGRVGDERLQLVQTSSNKGRYICLSHCWGTKRAFETTTKNLHEMQEGFAMTDLPPTYRDAVVMSRLFGIEYLWIDSLCIIQNSRDDWLQESAQMMEIYSRSFLTLAATRAGSQQAGLFHDHRDHEFIGKEGTDSLYRVLCRPLLQHYSPMLDTGDEEGTRNRFPLLSRAWVCQERLLSPRVLHFGPQELFWECRESATCECRRWNTEDAFTKLEYVKILENGTDRDIQTLWTKIVSAYSGTHLTMPSDKLPALSGITKQFLARLPGSRYIAGLWSSSLLEDFLWHIPLHRQGVVAAKPTDWRAPSWSWASLECKIDYPFTHLYTISHDIRASYSEIRVLEYVPAGDDITGEAKSAQVTILGPVIHGHSNPTPRLTERDYAYDISVSDFEFTTHPDKGTAPVYQLYLDSFGYHDWTTTDDQLVDTEVTFLRLCRVRRDDVFSYYNLMEYILLLRHSHHSGFYERVGLAEVKMCCSGTTVDENKAWNQFRSPFDQAGQKEHVTIL
ncbi:HET-domain-containing protein [Lophiostoma macrostomum CBS 122681]|uniref:HET-domain-containing protein n=1 Tax=Lophiostoma macrostomum CBS 122681 TaxID=1314788 RepID=A0A6A6SVV1_9PLEO|nr:HET-domain-containing protein [Lophiostoma macrostomum CBS 122681]